MEELTLHDTHGILRQPWVRPARTSAGLGWPGLYVSVQHELPYEAAFGGAPSHLVILHLSGPVTVRRGLVHARTIPAGGFFVHPSGRELTVELGGALDTVHVYLADKVLQDARADGAEVELLEELGSVDPLLEQLVLALDGVLRRPEPAARTYVDHVTAMLAARLAWTHAAGRRATAAPDPKGLGDRQLAAVRELLTERLAEPIPLADMAAAAGLSVSQFARQFKARTGMAPHRFLVHLRVDRACELLRHESASISEIALRCGFSHQEHLTRVMRAQLRTTPAAVRRDAVSVQ
jgi:AraC family transcriptional regulator